MTPALVPNWQYFRIGKVYNHELGVGEKQIGFFLKILFPLTLSRKGHMMMSKMLSITAERKNVLVKDGAQ